MLPVDPTSTIELVPTVLRSAFARDTATVNPTMLSSQALGDLTHPVIYSLIEPSSPGLLNSSSQTDQTTISASETAETSSDIDMFWCLDEREFSQDTAAETSLVLSSPRDGTPNIQTTLLSPAHTVSHAEPRRSQTKRRPKTSTRSPKSGVIRVMIDDWVSQEREQRRAENLPPPDNDYLHPEVQDQIISLNDEFFAAVLVKIAGPRQMVALREIICNERNQKDLRSFLFVEGMPIRKRLGIIIGLERKLAATQLFRWYHILRLFEDCGGRDALSFSGNWNTTPATYTTAKQGRGNPMHKEDSLVAKAMVHECFPEMTPDSEDFKLKLSFMKRIRKLGKRLHMLTEKFGLGVLGLLFDLNARNDALATADCRYVKCHRELLQP